MQKSKEAWKTLAQNITVLKFQKCTMQSRLRNLLAREIKSNLFYGGG